MKHPILNLAKYDLKYIIKGAGVFAIILFICAICFNLTCYDVEIAFDETGAVISEVSAPVIVQILHTIFYNAIFGFVIGLVLNCVMRLWHRFSSSCYGDPSYLTHTLPITKFQLWTAKFLTVLGSILFVITSIVVSFLVLNLTRYGKDLISVFGIVPGIDIPAYLLVISTQFIFTTLCGITGIIVSHRFNKPSAIKTILCGFALYLLGACVLLMFTGIWGIFDNNVASILFGNASLPASATTGSHFINQVLLNFGLAYVAMIASLYFLDYKLLQRGVNVE